MQEVTMMHQKANTTKVPKQAFSCRFSDKGPLSNALSKLLASNVVGSFVYTCSLKNSWRLMPDVTRSRCHSVATRNQRKAKHERNAICGYVIKMTARARQLGT